MKAKELSDGQRFRFDGDEHGTVWLARGGCWFGSPGGFDGGPWVLSDDADVTLVECEAASIARGLQHMESAGQPIICIPAPETVSCEEYRVGFFSDGSACFWTAREGYGWLSSVTVGERESCIHALRCIARFEREARAKMVDHQERWVDGVLWSNKGEFLGV